MNNDPFIFNDKENRNQLLKSFVIVDKRSEDLQAMTFYCWLKSKVSNTNFYTSLLEVVRLE